MGDEAANDGIELAVVEHFVFARGSRFDFASHRNCFSVFETSRPGPFNRRAQPHWPNAQAATVSARWVIPDRGQRRRKGRNGQAHRDMDRSERTDGYGAHSAATCHRI